MGRGVLVLAGLLALLGMTALTAGCGVLQGGLRGVPPTVAKLKQLWLEPDCSHVSLQSSPAFP